MNRFVAALFSIGLALMPFSTQPKAGTTGGILSIGFGAVGVVHFGMPLLVAAIVASIYQKAINNDIDVRIGKVTLGIAGLYVVWMIGMSFATTNLSASLSRSSVNVIGYVLVWIICSAKEAERNPKRISHELATWLTISNVVLSLYYLINLALQLKSASFESLFSERYIGGAISLPWGATNTIASPLLLGLAVAAHQYSKRRAAPWFLAAGCVILVAIVFTLSRNAVICTCIFVLGYLVIAQKREGLLIVAAIILLSMATMHWVLNKGDINFIVDTRLSDVGEIRTLNSRDELWVDVLGYIEEHPYAPIGYYGSQAKFGVSAHNWTLTTLVELGFPGLLLGIFCWGAPVVLLLKASRRSKGIPRRSVLVLCLGWVMSFVNLQAEDAHFTHVYIVYYWVYMAVCIVCSTGVIRAEYRPSGSHNVGRRFGARPSGQDRLLTQE